MGGRFEWPETLFDEAKRLYLEACLEPRDIAETLTAGPFAALCLGLSAVTVRRLVDQQGWAAERAPEAARRARAKREAHARALLARKVKTKPPKPAPHGRPAVVFGHMGRGLAKREATLPPRREDLRAELAQLCDGVAVTVCASAYAAGLSKAEEQFGAVSALASVMAREGGGK